MFCFVQRLPEQVDPWCPWRMFLSARSGFDSYSVRNFSGLSRVVWTNLTRNSCTHKGRDTQTYIVSPMFWVSTHLLTTSILIRSCWSAPLLLLGLGIVCVVYPLFGLANYKDPCKRCVLARCFLDSFLAMMMVIMMMMMMMMIIIIIMTHPLIVFVLIQGLNHRLFSFGLCHPLRRNGFFEIFSEFYPFLSPPPTFLFELQVVT